MQTFPRTSGRNKQLNNEGAAAAAGCGSAAMEKVITMDEYVLQMNNIVKSFSFHRVLKNVTLKVRRGEVHALCGENGAGKSTMMKILSGFYPHGEYEGEVIVDGQICRFSNTRESTAAGIEIIYQELEVANNMTVAENIYLGCEPTRYGIVDQGKMIDGARKVLGRLKADINPTARVGELGVGMRQMVAIARSLLKEPKVLILDEPSAALTEKETSNLLQIIRDLKASGVTCVYISHRLDEVMEIADRITVIRDGETIVTDDRRNMDKEKLIQYMVGRKLSEQFDKTGIPLGEEVLKVEHLSAISHKTGKPILKDLSFNLRKGEILGFAGLMGAGRTETAMAIMGMLNAKISGSILLHGSPIMNRTPHEAIRSGINIVTEDRKELGLILGVDIKNNIILSSLDKVSQAGVIRQNEVIRYADEYFRILKIRAESSEQLVGRLSGGNQQKVVIAKALMTEPDVLILDEPTRGIDVGAKAEIYQIMDQLVKSGMSIIMISSELPEVLAMSDRIAVMSSGKITAILNNHGLQQETIMQYATEE